MNTIFFKRSIFKLGLISLLFSITGVFASGRQEVDFPNSSIFRNLSIEEQFYFYLQCDPPSGYGYPRQDTYADYLAQSEDWVAIFNKAKEYALTIDLSLADNEIDISDYRFTLILNLFGQMSYYHEFTEEQKDWLIIHYRGKLIQYIKNEKRIDSHAIDVAEEIASLENSYPNIQFNEWGEYIYKKYVGELHIIPLEEVKMSNIFIFPGYKGKIIEDQAE